MFSINRNEANGMYANKDLFAVDESVQREALKNFYEQRAGVRFKHLKFETDALLHIHTTHVFRWRKRS